MSADLRLRSFIDRVLRLKEEQDALAADIREVYAEAKGEGYDKTAMGQLVAHLRKVEKVGVAAVEEGQSIFDLYLAAYQRGTGTGLAIAHTHEAGETGMVLGTGKERPLSIGLHTDGNPEARFESASLHQTEQPETANQSEGRDHSGGANEYAGTSSDENPAPIPNPQPTSSPEADKAETENPLPVSAPNFTGPQPLAVSGGEPSIPSSDDGGAKTESDANRDPGRSDDQSARKNTQSEQAANSFIAKDRAERNERCQNPLTCKLGHHPQKITCSTCSTAWAIAQRKARAA